MTLRKVIKYRDSRFCPYCGRIQRPIPFPQDKCPRCKNKYDPNEIIKTEKEINALKLNEKWLKTQIRTTEKVRCYTCGGTGKIDRIVYTPKVKRK